MKKNIANNIRIELYNDALIKGLNSLVSKYNGSFDGRMFWVNNSMMKWKMEYYEFVDGFECVISDYIGTEDTDLFIHGVEPDIDNSIYFRLDFTEENTLNQALHDQGICVHSSSYSLKTHIKKNQPYRCLLVKISKNMIDQQFPFFKEILLQKLKPSLIWVQYGIVPFSLYLLLRSIFYVDNDLHPAYRKSILIGRSIEAVGISYATLFDIDNKKKSPIHKDDLKELIELKNMIIKINGTLPSLEDLAFQYGASVSKLRRDFKIVYGMSIHSYHNNYRLEEAKKYIFNNNLTISEISRKLGFPSVAKFSTVFKKKFGLSPKQYMNISVKK